MSEIKTPTRPDALRRALTLSPLALAAGGSLALSACGGGGGDAGDNGDSDDPRLRFVNASSEYTTLKVFLNRDSRPVIPALANGGATTGYDWLSRGTHSVRMTSSDPEGEITGSKDFAERTYTTALAYGPRGLNGRLLFIDENEDGPGSLQTKLRVVHVSTLNGNLDVYVTRSDLTSLTNETPLLSNVRYGDLSAFATRSSGSVALHLTAAGSKTELLYRAVFTAPSNSVITLALLPRNGELNVTALPQRQNGNPIDNQLP
ncbi:DUF4397 domain-containing protein [Aquabacterium sp. A7-Y]|uniref:DUF4397 domain-containing protein n=1 Tax=Aquabacterium sp. A7-Y TaxID=1349605 RepID=UPI00223E3CDC|nr:DUF4397 domain-containing protein [Aquabacterium sp. A7-Y]MCW7539521.1 DUF4397 domain-containing protein [Aquabacterium sp. A7-Y]